MRVGVTGVLVRVCLSLAVLKVLAGFTALVAGVPSSSTPVTPFSDVIYLLHIVVFGIVGTLLIYASGSDRRAAYLGVAFCLIAASFSDPLVRRLPDLWPEGIGSSVNLLLNLHPDAFLPYFLWLFFSDFPHSYSSARINRFLRVVLRLSLFLGTALFLANALSIVPSLATSTSNIAIFLRVFKRSARVSYYWTIIFALEIPAIPIALWRARGAGVQERRRVRMFLAGLGIGSLPMMLEVVLEVIFPRLKALMSNPSARLWGGLILYPLLLSMPVTTAYSVLVNRVLEVKVILRQALRYALARYSVVSIAAIPLLVIALDFYKHRDETVSNLLSGLSLVGLLSSTLFGVLAFSVRHKVFNAIDRRYFRENYDSRTILTGLVEKSRSTSSVDELAVLLQAEIDRALHLESVTLLSLEPKQGVFQSPSAEIRSLSSSSTLVALAEGSAEPLDIDLENPTSLLRRLSLDDQQWLADGAFRLLVPLIASDGRLIGLIALGSKKSELRFSGEDRSLLSAIAGSVALTLENRFFRKWIHPAEKSVTTTAIRERSSVEDELASECQACRALRPPRASICSGCGGQVESAQVPYILLGKFRLERRIGSGGMGVVYRAVDLVLGRAVAIKTLPRVSPEDSMRLRREARAMATVIHPNLALIFGAETWRGIPMLIFEYLDGGTLADKLKVNRLSVQQAVQLGLTLANVLDKTHAAGILHRDIKPSNIGYTLNEVPKLLDFGLAHVLYDSRRETRLRNPLIEDQSGISTLSFPVDVIQSITPSGFIVGTPIYLSPEGVQNMRPDPSFDLWAVAIVLYEAMAGQNPMVRHSLKDTLVSISRGDVPDIRETVPDCPASMVRFFKQALASDPALRPGTAAELFEALQRVASSL